SSGRTSSSATSTRSLHDALPIFLGGDRLIEFLREDAVVDLLVEIREGLVRAADLAGLFRLVAVVLDEIVVGDFRAVPLAFVHLRSEEHTSELQSRENLVCRLLLE